MLEKEDQKLQRSTRNIERNIEGNISLSISSGYKHSFQHVVTLAFNGESLETLAAYSVVNMIRRTNCLVQKNECLISLKIY